MQNEIIELIEAHKYAKVRELFLEMNVVDIAGEIEGMDEPVAITLFRMLPKDTAAEVFAYLTSDMQQSIIEAITDREIGDILNDLFLDDAVDFIEEMPASVVKRVLANVSKKNRELINQFLKYPEDSVGSIMTIEYVYLRDHNTVAEAFERVRHTGSDKETIYMLYVTDREAHLMGALSAKSLMLASPGDTIGSLMETNIISAHTHDDRESLSNEFTKYGLLTMPVVDNENRLVGIVTVDDVLEVQQEETTEDFERMAAMLPSENPYLKSSVVTLSKNRIFWLLLLMLSATINGAIIGDFEEALAVLPALVAYIPMLMGTGGNAGAQSSTLVIRGLALEEISIGDTGRIFVKEILVAALCGIVLFTVNFLRIIILGGDILISLSVSLSLFATILLANVVGGLLPLFAKRFKMDPAVMAAPVITTIIDAASLLVFFAISKAILQI